ncbi:amino acid synthesis family protein [Leucobacter triazinivorans]|uniref:Amino acid synthesis family protein n=1 Tax=Leucobacter triazinivorans TaxID=1784719 RepID=A0A4P6KDD9_9MICO|nr:amino acid synthesis family protein [Leucobacter triazinivorans]QBE48070.1 amino acid synthesis family protein [Leucobacter triazinivorans]
MAEHTIEIRKTFSQIEEVRTSAGTTDSGGPLRKVAVCAVIRNPYAGRGYVEDLSALIDASGEVGTLLGAEALRLLGAPVASYGKAGLVGSSGEQEHINAALTSVFGNAFRAAIGGGEAWITSMTKRAGAGTLIDVPTAYKDDVWVRSHYDGMEVRVPDAPQADEIVVIAAVTNRGRINARVGGMSVAEVQEKGL